jgi:hypothetical protein
VFRIENVQFVNETLDPYSIKTSDTTLGMIMEQQFNEEDIDRDPPSWRVRGVWTRKTPLTARQEKWILGVPEFLPSSLITNTTMKGIQGIHASLLQAEDSSIVIRESRFVESFVQAVSSSPMKFKRSEIIIQDNCHFEGNVGDYGGALHATDHSSLILNETTFHRNLAKRQGGAIMLDNESFMEGNLLSFHDNESWFSGAVLYVSNVEDNDIVVTNSQFTRNIAQ